MEYKQLAVFRGPIEMAIGETPLICTKHEALSIFQGWHESSTPLLSRSQPAAGVEPLFLKGRIAHVVSDELFGNPALSVTVGFGPVSFEYEELPKAMHRPGLQRIFDVRIKVQLFVAQEASLRDRLIEPETTMILTEMAV